MLKEIEFDGLPQGVTIQIEGVILVGTQIDIPEKEKESA
jgi:hypothetical protein